MKRAAATIGVVVALKFLSFETFLEEVAQKDPVKAIEKNFRKLASDSPIEKPQKKENLKPSEEKKIEKALPEFAGFADEKIAEQLVVDSGKIAAKTNSTLAETIKKTDTTEEDTTEEATSTDEEEVTTQNEVSSSQSSNVNISSSSSSGAIFDSIGAQSLLVNADNLSGIYFENPFVTLTGVNVSEIRYCLSFTKECCAPDIVYDGAIEVSRTPGFYAGGNYCLSYQGYYSDSLKTKIYENAYLVDNTLPAMTSSFYPNAQLERIQTNERHHLLRTTSPDFGMPDFYHFTLALGGLNPSVTYADCAETIANHKPIDFAMRSPAGVTVFDGVNLKAPGPVDVIVSNLNEVANYGENYLVSVMEKVDTSGSSIFSCITNKVVLRDFYVSFPSHTGSYQSPENAQKVNQFQGMILDYGPFNAGGDAPGVAPGPQFNLESQFVNIIN